jgi:hypothetical protein
VSETKPGNPRAIIALVVMAAIAVAVLIATRQGQSPPEAPGNQPALVGGPTPPAAAAAVQEATATPAMTPIYSAWLKYEPARIAESAIARDFYIDATLGHQVFQLPPSGVPGMQASAMMLEDDELLLASGRRLWNRELIHAPGLVGKFCFVHSRFCAEHLFDTSFFIDGQPAIVYVNRYVIERYPSHTLVKYEFPGVLIEERKYITWQDQAAATYDIRSTDKKPHRVTLEINSTYPPIPNAKGTPAYPLLGSGQWQGSGLFLYLDAPDFTPADSPGIHLHRALEAAADGSPQRAQVAVSFETREQATRPRLPDDLIEQHRRSYNQWFADNVPYFDASEPGFKKMWFYRWWVVRFNMNQFDTSDLRNYSFYEGKLGFDNVISFAVPIQLKELSYLRDPAFGLDQALNSYRNVASNGAVVDPPGSPYWGETYSHWIASALAEYHRVHPIPAPTLKALLPAMAGDVRAWMTAYDSDGDGLSQRLKPRVTGYDLDILSFWYFSGLRYDPYADLVDLERVDFASFVYANAVAIADLARQAGDAALAEEFSGVAARIRKAVLTEMWDEKTHFFYPQRASDDKRIPVRELHGFFPFTTLLAPDEKRYTAALDKLVDENEFWSRFPPVITSLAHYRDWTWEMDGLTRNIAPHPITMGARTVIQAIKHYPDGPVKPRHFMELLRRYNDLVYPGVNPFDPHWRPNAHEYFSKWEPNQLSPRPKPSDISHDFHSAYCYLVVEGAVGLTPRDDEKIEIQPAALEWDYFLLDRLRYRGHDLTIVWDRPNGRAQYAGFPEGFSLYIDGEAAFTRADLAHVIFDPQTRAVEVR